MMSLAQKIGRWEPLSDERFYLALLAFLAVLAAGVALNFALIMDRNFLTIACDTAVLQSGIVNTMHGNWFANNGPGGPNILGSHTTFLLLLMIPFYVLVPSADTLFTLQVIGVYSTVIPLYLVGVTLLRQPLMAFCVAASALASPILLHMAVAPFHLETWVAAAAFWSYYFYLRGHIRGFLISFLVAVCSGEQAALIYVALGIALFAVEDGLSWRRTFARISIIGGLFWIAFAVMVVAPLGRGSHSFNIFAYNYTPWHVQSISGLPGAVARNPYLALGMLFGLARWGHIAGVVGLALLGAFTSVRSLILLAPVPVYLLMSGQEFFLFFHAYYYSFAFFAGYLGTLFLLARLGTASRAALGILSTTGLINVILLCGAAGYYAQLGGDADGEFSRTLRDVFAGIPTDATVYTPHRYSAYLSNRENMVIGDVRDENFDFKAMMDSRFAETNVRPEQVDFIVCDLLTDQCGFRGGGFSQKASNRRAANITKLIESGLWKIYWGQSDVVILRRARE